MSTPSPKSFSPESIRDLLRPYVGATSIPSDVYAQLSLYLQLILKWNARINLTAIRDPTEIVHRHFGESLFAGLHLNLHKSNNLPQCDSLLDLGSGAGFPGIPIQLLFPKLSITLAESRSRKVAFLREVVRTLNLRTAIWPDRAESMPENRRFDVVALRAVDEINLAISEAGRRAMRRILILGTTDAIYPTLPEDFKFRAPLSLPKSSDGALRIADRVSR